MLAKSGSFLLIFTHSGFCSLLFLHKVILGVGWMLFTLLDSCTATFPDVRSHSIVLLSSNLCLTRNSASLYSVFVRIFCIACSLLSSSCTRAAFSRGVFLALNLITCSARDSRCAFVHAKTLFSLSATLCFYECTRDTCTFNPVFVVDENPQYSHLCSLSSLGATPPQYLLWVATLNAVSPWNLHVHLYSPIFG